VLVAFLKEILGLPAVAEAEARIRESFQTFMIEQNKHYSADQLNFIRMIESVFAKNHRLAEEDLWGPPFTNFGMTAPVPMFTEDVLDAFVGICRRLAREIFATAEA
jgi:type I restriction enzyme R subunit